MTLVIDLVPHLDAGDRTKWRGDQNQRPLSELGRRQAVALAEALAAEPVDALYSSPALRCRETLEPLAERLGLEISILPELREMAGLPAPDDWISGRHGGAYAAGRAMSAIERFRQGNPEGRFIACSHGDIVPALVCYLAGVADSGSVPDLAHRGQWHRVHFDAVGVAVELRGTMDGFPT